MQSPTFMHDMLVHMREARPRFVSPQAVVQEMSLAAGDHVIDIRTESGYFAGHIGRAIGEKGCVYLRGDTGLKHTTVYRDAVRNNPSRVCLLPASDDNLLDLDAGTIDAVLMVRGSVSDVLLAEVARLTRRGGVVCVVDWRGGEPVSHTTEGDSCSNAVPPFGLQTVEPIIGPCIPHSDGEGAVTASAEEECVGRFSGFGFVPVRKLSVRAVGSYHYGILFTRV